MCQDSLFAGVVPDPKQARSVYQNYARTRPKKSGPIYNSGFNKVVSINHFRNHCNKTIEICINMLLQFILIKWILNDIRIFGSHLIQAKAVRCFYELLQHS